MYVAIVWTVVALAVTVTSLSVFVVLARIVADWRHGHRGRLRGRMTEQLAAFLTGDISEAAASAELGVDRTAALDALVRVASAQAGARVRLAPLFRELGFVEQETSSLRHRNWARRLRAASNLGVMGERGVAPALVHALGDEMLDVRLAAARSLGQLPAPEAVESVLRALALPGELPLKLAADVVLEFGDAMVEPLLAFLRRPRASTDAPALAVVATVLGISRTTAAVPLLLETLADPEPELRVNAARALGLIGAPQALAALCALARDPVWQVRSAAAQALGRIGDTQAIPTLEGRLIDVAWWVRFNAAEALFQLGYAGRERLLETLALHRDRFARDVSLQVLEEHAPPEPPEVHAL